MLALADSHRRLSIITIITIIIIIIIIITDEEITSPHIPQTIGIDLEFLRSGCIEIRISPSRMHQPWCKPQSRGLSAEQHVEGGGSGCIIRMMMDVIKTTTVAGFFACNALAPFSYVLHISYSTSLLSHTDQHIHSFSPLLHSPPRRLSRLVAVCCWWATRRSVCGPGGDVPPGTLISSRLRLGASR